MAQIMQPTAAMIVFGGTLGAVMIQFPLPVVLAAFGRLGSVFFNKAKDPHVHNADCGYAQKARKEGIVSLDSETGRLRIPS